MEAAGDEPVGAHARIRGLMSQSGRERREAAKALLQAPDPALVPGLVDALFFTARAQRGEILDVLRVLAGADAGREYYDWVALVGRRQDLRPAPGYLQWKRELLSRIDARYGNVLFPEVPVRIRLEEIVWGGVALDGIPALETPPHVAAAKAGLSDRERVLGLSVNGEHRVYPLRYLSWHEMANDKLGGQPITVSLCTLCGSGVAYSARTPGGGAYSFGTSGLLYRSNKLMYDRQTFTLWSNLTGEPVVGRLAGSPVRLGMLPVSLTTWGEWRRRHPDTTAVKLDAEYGRRWSFEYRPGAADRARAGVSFPVWQKSGALPEREEVFGLRLGTAAKAYPLEALSRAGAVNDTLDGRPIVLFADAGGAARAYERGAHTFGQTPDASALVDEGGRTWRLEEDALRPQGGGPELQPLGRLPGHVAFWFGWFGFFPHTEVWIPSPAP